MTDDPIRSAFATFRADQLPRLAIPDVSAARRTVRRRRRLTTGAAAGITTMLLLGIGYAVAAGTGAEPAPLPDQASTTVAPVARGGSTTAPPDEPDGPGDGLGELSAITATALGLDGTSEGGVIFEVEASEPLTFDPAAFVRAVTGSESDPFRIRVACGGAGTATITLGTSNDEATVTARCGTTAEEIADGAEETSFTLDDGPFVEVSVDRDEGVTTVAFEVIPA